MRILITLSIIFFFNYSFAINKIALGSCNKHNKPQPLWTVLAEHNPDLFIWLGDTVYGDTYSMSKLKKKYDKQNTRDDYKKFIQDVPIIGIWDDHDFGKNNIGKKYTQKKKSQQLFLDFIKEPQDSIRRKQEGIYTSYTYTIQKKKIKFILLDARYFRDTPNQQGSDILGSEQWKWLEDELMDNVDLNFIVSGYSVLSPSIPFSEEWAKFPYAKKKLFNLIESTDNTRKVVFLTGDRHFSAILSKEYKGNKYMELMVSGLTHTVLRTKGVKRLVERIYGKEDYYFGLNAGLLEFYPSKKKTVFKFTIVNDINEPVLEKIFKF